MHNKKIELWQHDHYFNLNKERAERKTLIIIIITVLTMFIEIFAGWIFKSMALFSDGWHMFTHAGALSITLISYVLARKLSSDSKFAFGTWKIEILGAFSSSILLGLVGLFVLYLSVERLIHPQQISFNSALIVAVGGLVINFVCALILHGGHSHDDMHSGIAHGHSHGSHSHGDSHHKHESQNHETHDHPHPHKNSKDDHHTHDHGEHRKIKKPHADYTRKEHSHDHDHDHPHPHPHPHKHPHEKHEHHDEKHSSHPHSHPHEEHEHPHPHPHEEKREYKKQNVSDIDKDLNLRSAYMHVIADALTSVMAIIALLGAKYYNLVWLDPAMGIVSSVLIFRWTYSLLRDTSVILLEREMDSGMISEIKKKIESDNDSKIYDLHLWRVSQDKYACIISLVAKNPGTLKSYKDRLKSLEELVHVTIEIDHCRE